MNALGEKNIFYNFQNTKTIIDWLIDWLIIK